MNERILELAEQCEGRTICECGETGFNYKKFAELIIRECADVAVKFHLAHPYSVEYQIKKHFGVE